MFAVVSLIMSLSGIKLRQLWAGKAPKRTFIDIPRKTIPPFFERLNLVECSNKCLTFENNRHIIFLSVEIKLNALIQSVFTEERKVQMLSDTYRQSPEFRAEAIRQAEIARLVKTLRTPRRIFRPFGRSTK